jgi:hypothetical protein
VEAAPVEAEAAEAAPVEEVEEAEEAEEAALSARCWTEGLLKFGYARAGSALKSG